MIPNSVLSTTARPGDFLAPRNIAKEDLVDYEMGGTDISNGSAGMQVKVWTGEYVGNDVVLSASGVSDHVALTQAGIVELSITFDRSMRPHVAYKRDNDLCYWYWYDTLANAYATLTLPVGTDDPRCSLDDKRSLQSSSSDVILSYIRDQKLYFRAQRERYQTEHELVDGLPADAWLDNIGMNDVGRFQFHLMTPEPATTGPVRLRYIHDDEATWPLYLGSKLHMREVVCAPHKGTERKPCSPKPLKPNCDRVK